MQAALLVHPRDESADRSFMGTSGFRKMAVGRFDIAIHIDHRLAVARERHGQIRGNGGLAGAAFAAGTASFMRQPNSQLGFLRLVAWRRGLGFPACAPARPRPRPRPALASTATPPRR